MVQYKLFVLLAVCCGAYGAGYEPNDFISTGICPTRRNVLLETFLSPQKEIQKMPFIQKGLMYEQTWNSSSFKRYSDCKFTLQAPPGAGLYLIVRKLNLRRDPKGNCIDTVVVKQSNNKKTRFCYTPTDVPRSFSDNSHMKITIKLDHYVPLPTVDDTLQIQLIATPRVKCTDNLFMCEPFDLESCIDASFQRDGTINCPSCTDEDGCSKDSEKVYVANKQNIALMGILSLFITLFGCIGCIWCVYKNRRCISPCSSGTGGGGRRPAGNDGTGLCFQRPPNTTRSVGLAVELSGSSHDLRPSAPALDDKDLPPSYDALFPTTPVGSNASGQRMVSTATSPTIPSTAVEARQQDSAK